MIKNIPSIKINNPGHKNLSDTKKYIPKPYKDVARGMEAQFARYMIQQMRKTIDKSKVESSATKYYNSIVDGEHAKTLTKTNGGLGIQNLILDKIYPERFRNPMAYRQYELQLEQQQKHLKNERIRMKKDEDQIVLKSTKEVQL